MKLLCVFTGLYCPFCPVEFPVCKGRCLNFSDFIWRCWTSLYQCPILPNQSFIISVDGYPLVKLYTQKNTCWDFGCDCVEFRVSLEDEWHLCPVKSSFHSRPESDGPSHSLLLSSLSELSQKEMKLTQTPYTYFMKQKQKRLIADIDDIFITDKILN